MQYRFFTKIFNRFSYRLSHRNFNNQSSRFSSSLNRSSKAFTLIEILIYTAIFSVVAAGIIGVAWNVTRIHTSQIAENEVDENLRYVMDLINSKVRDASIIQDATGTTLILQMPDSTKSPVIFSLNNGTIFMQEGTADPVAITSDKVVVTALEFQRVSMPRAKDGIRINLTIAYKEPTGSTGAEREYLTTVSRVHAIVFDSDILPRDSNLYNVGLDVARWKSGYFSDNINVGGNITAVGTVTGSAGLCMGSDCRSSWGQVTGVTGSGTQNYITKWASSGSLTNSQIFDNGTSVGIGTTSPGALLDVQGAAQFGTGNVNLINAAGKIAGISSTYFADLSGANLTNLNASNLGSGTVPPARISGSYTGITGVGTLTAGTWNATPIADAYIASASTWNAKMTNPMTTVGDIIYGGTSGAPTRLAGSAGFLKSTGAAAPSWTALSASDIPGLDANKITSGTLPVARGGTGAGTFSSGYLIKGNGTNALSSSVIYDNGTNVGIGTTAPGAKLHVYDSSSNVPLLVQAGYGSSAIKFKDSSTIGSGPFVGSYGDDLQLGTGDLQRMRITSAGNVGIGTTSPGTKLDVAGDFKTVKYGVYDEEAGSATGNINGNYLRFLVNNGEKVRITSDGNVGIGTTAPSAQLHTTSGVRFQGIANNFTNRRMIVSDTSGNLAYRDLENPISFLDAPFGQYVMYTPTTNNVLFAADKRFTVTQTDFSSFSAGGLFNSNYDDLPAKITTDNATGVININLIEKGEFGSSGLVYSYGWVYVHFYHYYYTDNVKVRLKTKNAGGEFVWRDYVVGTNISSQDNTRVMKIPLFGNYYCSDIEIDITADTVNGSGTKNVWVSEIEFIVNRSASEFAQPIVSKHLANSIYGTMSFKNGSNVVTASIIPSTGAAYFLGNVGIGTTATSQKLTVNNGNIDVIGSAGGLRLGASNWSDGGTTYGHIISDNGSYKALMIVGNDISGNSGKGREVKVWDYLNVQGGLNVTGQFYSVGNTSIVTNLNADMLDGHHWSEVPTIPANNVTGSGTANYVSKWTGTYTQGNSQIFDNGTNVGIGTTSPAYKLDVVGDIKASGSVYGTYAGTIPASQISQGQFGSGSGGGIYSFPSKLGVGTSTPTTALEVVGKIKTGSFQLAAGAIEGYVLTADASGNATWQPSLPGLPSATTGQTIYFNGTNWAATSNLYSDDSEVGIGTTSPQAKLHVNINSGTYVCNGTARSCYSFVDESACTAQSGCSWTTSVFDCRDLPQAECYEYSGCVWSGDSCSGHYSESSCTGTATQCSSISNQTGCNAQSGCSWIYISDPVAVFTGGRVGIGTTNPATTTALDVNGIIQGKFADKYTGSNSRLCSSGGNGTSSLPTDKYYPEWFCALGFTDPRETDTATEQAKCAVALDGNNQWLLQATLSACGDQSVYCGINCIRL